MADSTAVSAALAELVSIANAAMTSDQRVTRAAPVLSGAGLSVGDVIGALQSPDLAWTVNKASAFGIPVQSWLEAVDIVCHPRPADLPGLLECLHKSESAAAMVKAGYRATRDPAGKVAWSR